MGSEPLKPDEFEIFEPFDIDDKLDDFRREYCFVLGYELAQVHALFRRGEPFEKQIHFDNAERVMKSAERNGVPLVWTRINDDWGTIRREAE